MPPNNKGKQRRRCGADHRRAQSGCNQRQVAGQPACSSGCGAAAGGR